MRNYKFAIVAALLVALFLVGGLHAAPVAETHYNQLPTASAPGFVHSSSSSADSVNWQTTVPLHPIKTGGNPNLSVACDFSAPAATCTLEVGLYHYDGTNYTFLGIAGVSTATAANLAAFGTIGGQRYPAILPSAFDTRSANVVDLRVTNISTGNVGTRPWLYGSAPKGKD